MRVESAPVRASAMKAFVADARTRLQKANRQLRDEAARRQVQRIGSTVIVLLACDRFCGYLWAGDSRLYLYRDGHDTFFRLHGTTEPDTIGTAVSSGCIRLFNQDIIDLYDRVPVGAHVTVVQG